MAVRWNLRVGEVRIGSVRDGGDQPGVFKPGDGLVHRSPRPAGDGRHLHPVEEGHTGQEPEQLPVHRPHFSRPDVRLRLRRDGPGISGRAWCAACAAAGPGVRRSAPPGYPGRSRAFRVPAGTSSTRSCFPVSRSAVSLGFREVAPGLGADAVSSAGVALLRLPDHHGEGGHAFPAHGGPDVAVVHRKRRDVVLAHPLLAQFPYQLPCVVPRNLEDG